MSTVELNFIGERVQYARKLLNLTTKELGERVGQSQGQISHIENGRRTPNTLLIQALAQELGVREEWLIGGEEPIYPELINLNDEDIATKYVDESLNASQYNVDVDQYQELVAFAIESLGKLRKDLNHLLIPDQKQKSKSGENVIKFRTNSGDMLIGSHSQKIITQKHTTRTINKPPDGSITEQQARQIQELLVRIGSLETIRMGNNAYGVVMNQFKQRYEITSYKNLSIEKFEEALDYLLKREKIAEKNAIQKGVNPVSRNEYIRRIQTICRKELNWNDVDRKREIFNRFKKISLSDLDMYELENFYKFVLGKKSKKK